jgi:uncharacterized radical SAM superfamily Fe-S cluster-containing enzyme
MSIKPALQGFGSVPDRSGDATDKETLGMTQSVCSRCRALIPAKIITDGRDVHFHKFCPEHGESRVLVRSDLKDYLRSLRYVKPAWEPRTFMGDAKAGCPEGCGFCERHEQHLCMPIIEITNRCDLVCPVCINASGRVSKGTSPPWDLSLHEFRRLLDVVLEGERQVDLLNLSGGEPLLHPRLLDMMDEALSRKEIVRVSLSTNGLRFRDEPGLLQELHRRHVVVSLQFDGFNEAIYETLRGKPMLREKLEILDMLEDCGITTSLTMTAAGGVNDDQFSPMLDYLFDQDHVVSLMVQPIAFAGRGGAMRDKINRLTIPDVVRLLGSAGHPAVKAHDFVPLPCSHPLCFSLAFYLMLENGGAVSVSRLTDAAPLMDSLSNRVIFGLDLDEHQRLKQMIYDLWSGPSGAVPENKAVLETLRNILRKMSRTSCGCFDPREAFTLAERSIKSIFIHAFQDAETFDLARVRRCCQAYPQPDGKLIPACVHNVLGREKV